MKYSIQLKILISFSIIIYLGLSALLFVSYKLTEQNDSNIIYHDMISAKKNMDQYLRQYFLLNNIEFSETALMSEAADISKQLSSATENRIDIYNLKGSRMSNNPEEQGSSADNRDLINAINGKISYAAYINGSNAKVSLSYPIQVNDSYIGILRYTKDYTQLFNNSKRFRTVINVFATCIFSIVFVVSIILSRQITKPIKKLTETSEKVADGNFDIQMEVNTDDEIGDLSNRFQMMVGRIKEQIEIIKEDRDILKKSQAQNKVFFDNVTHELKTPITVIMGYAQALKENRFSDEKLFDKSVTYILNESIRLNNMVVELLELSKTSSADFTYYFENMEVGRIVAQTCEEMKIKGKKYNIDIYCDIEDSLYINCDKDRIKEVLINLLDNSMKYGYVNSLIEVRAYKENNCVFISVKDKGEGIAEENVKKLFDPFYRVSKKASRDLGSAGLGLTIVKSIVEKHCGDIEIKSKIGEGTEVIISFEENKHV